MLFLLSHEQIQQIKQNKQLFPLDVAAKQAGLLRGYTIPTSTVNTYEGSPLSALATLGTTTAGMFQKDDKGNSPWSSLMDSFANVYNGIKKFGS
jgi:hypothetical protein